MLRSLAVLALLAWVARPGFAAPPVLVLNRSEALLHPIDVPKAQPVAAAGYPYGYFGGQGGPRWSFHRGILGNYSQFTRR